MTQLEWRLSRELAQTKLALYQAQNAYLSLASQQVSTELAALGEQWAPDAPPEPPI